MIQQSEGKGDAAILVTREDHARLEALKLNQFEPFWAVVHRVLDSYDLSHPKMAPAASPEVPA
jgi:hypothetical protein